MGPGSPAHAAYLCFLALLVSLLFYDVLARPTQLYDSMDLIAHDGLVLWSLGDTILALGLY